MRGAAARRSEGVAVPFGAPLARHPEANCTFLIGKLVDAATLARAERLATLWGVAPQEVLIAAGWVGADDYARALAERYGLPFHAGPLSKAVPPGPSADLRDALAEGLLREPWTGGRCFYAPARAQPGDLQRAMATLGQERLALASPTQLRSAICRRFAPQLIRVAVEELHARTPEQSARSRLAAWQVWTLAATAALLMAALLLDPIGVVRFVSYLLVFLFIPVIAVRLVALGHLAHRQQCQEPRPRARIPDADLPVYTVLVALYREAKVLPTLLHGLTKLDYPAFGSKSTKVKTRQTPS